MDIAEPQTFITYTVHGLEPLDSVMLWWRRCFGPSVYRFSCTFLGPIRLQLYWRSLSCRAVMVAWGIASLTVGEHKTVASLGVSR